MRHAVLLIAALQLPLFVRAVAARADDRIMYEFNGKVGEKGVPTPWKLKTSTGEAWLAVERPEGSGAPELALRVKSDKASFFLAHSGRQFDPADYPVLEWSWKGVTLPTGGDVRKSSLLPFADNRNDQALQLLVTFDGGNVISYVWDSTAPVETEVKESNPFVNIMSVVVESGEKHLGEWRSYRRNVKDDYRRLHKGELRPIKAIAVQTNSNHTASKAEGFFGPIEFKKSR
jgi:hypothetical protein